MQLLGRSGRRLALAGALALAIIEPLCFWGSFAGDAEVHLVFAENASHGRFYEFNPGEQVSGETSAGYMLLGAMLFRVMRPRWVPVALKVLNLGAWYALGFFVYRVATRLLETKRRDVTAVVAALVAALIGGSLYDANVGMENGLFALAFWWWVDAACGSRWFSDSCAAPPLSTRRQFALSAALAASAWIRPEGVIIFICCHLYRLSSRANRTPAALGAAIAGLTIALSPVVFQFACTGDVIATSILSRRLLAGADALKIGAIRLDLRFAERLLVYAPLTFYFLVHVRRSWRGAQDPERILWLLLGVFFVGYTSVTNAAHLGRYVIFLMPILAIGAVAAASADWQSRAPRRRWTVALASIGFLATNIVELAYRHASYSQDLLWEAMIAPEQRSLKTERLLAELDRPEALPVIVALEPIQIRYGLDQRVLIRSMDGRTDRSMVAHSPSGVVDYVRYVSDSDIQYMYAPPGSVARSWPRAWADLQPGTSSTADGLQIKRLRSGVFQVSNRPRRGR
ncbi:MAG TPA: hypothetical protein VHH90_01170 [Polyangia bacterium]|nr:hypothetical protein [Polyangia bacterium]